MNYQLLTQINETALGQLRYEQLIEQTFDVLGFDREQVVFTNNDYQQFLEQVKDRPLLEMQKEERAGQSRGGEMEWMRDITQQKAQQKEFKGQRGIGIGNDREPAPKEGQRVVMPGMGGIGQIAALDLEHNQVMVRDKTGREFVVKSDELMGPKQVGKYTTWAIKK